MERFQVIYRLFCDNESEALTKAKDICLEQTVELPAECVPPGMISDDIVGRIEKLEKIVATKPLATESFLVTISYALESAALELTQLLNVIFGNISIKPAVRVERVELSPTLLSHFKGPVFGQSGIRDFYHVHHRPLLFTALKPMGLSAKELALLAYKFALGGIDLIKDDHGLTNQSYAPFEERVALCVEAIAKANQETGRKSFYVANITAPFNEIEKRARFAKEAGAGGVMIAPALTGFDAIRYLAHDFKIGLPIFTHPAFQGSYVTGRDGLSHFALFGQMTRLAGGDGVIYPNFGGRFSFSIDECRSIIDGCTIPMGEFKSIFPCPGGGMSLDRIEAMKQVYGEDVIFLVGGGLFQKGPDLIENCRFFRQMVV